MSCDVPSPARTARPSVPTRGRRRRRPVGPAVPALGAAPAGAETLDLSSVDRSLLQFIDDELQTR